MKMRKNLSPSHESLAGGGQIAADATECLSTVIGDHLAATSAAGAVFGDYWDGPSLKPLSRRGDARSAYLKRKHGS
jgi:hypothetical protein